VTNDLARLRQAAARDNRDAEDQLVELAGELGNLNVLGPEPFAPSAAVAEEPTSRCGRVYCSPRAGPRRRPTLVSADPGRSRGGVASARY
jgi:hypothetical protein